MGASNVMAVFARFRHLPHRPFRMLVFMAVVSLDNEAGGVPAATFFGGSESLAESIGYSREDFRERRRTILPAISKTIHELIQAGAVERVADAAPGRAAVYRLRLERGTVVPDGN